ncbi:hypothetical protein PR048_003473 [Dryococelus australis]|uniref:Uncharacterized protein n=1 Tax=Dryococelus australis TaxID=614101 RepID=A0ABQ9IN52_9NEOP|nr:hypothetical protein PR048_003473 [Dryococelus australis]
MHREEGLGKDLEGIGHGLCYEPIPAFACSDFGKPWKIEIRTRVLPNASPGDHGLGLAMAVAGDDGVGARVVEPGERDLQAVLRPVAHATEMRRVPVVIRLKHTNKPHAFQLLCPPLLARYIPFVDLKSAHFIVNSLEEGVLLPNELTKLSLDIALNEVTTEKGEWSGDIWTVPNSEILRADEGRENKEDPRENPPTSGIIRHDSHVRKSGSEPGRESNPIRLGGGSGVVRANRTMISGDAETNTTDVAVVENTRRSLQPCLQCQGNIICNLSGSISGRVTPRFSQVGIVSHDAAGRRVFSRGSHVFPALAFR